MRLLNEIELSNTRRKLSELETLYKSCEFKTGDDEELREMTLDSLQRLINQLNEEITRAEVQPLPH